LLFNASLTCDTQRRPVRVRVDIPELLPNLCEFLSSRGCVVVEVGDSEAEVVIPGAPSSFEAATTLLADLDLWRAKRPWARATLEPS
jgi:hypothetical protein